MGISIPVAGANVPLPGAGAQVLSPSSLGLLVPEVTHIDKSLKVVELVCFGLHQECEYNPINFEIRGPRVSNVWTYPVDSSVADDGLPVALDRAGWRGGSEAGQGHGQQLGRTEVHGCLVVFWNGLSVKSGRSLGLMVRDVVVRAGG